MRKVQFVALLSLILTGLVLTSCSDNAEPQSPVDSENSLPADFYDNWVYEPVAIENPDEMVGGGHYCSFYFTPSGEDGRVCYSEKVAENGMYNTSFPSQGGVYYISQPEDGSSHYNAWRIKGVKMYDGKFGRDESDYVSATDADGLRKLGIVSIRTLSKVRSSIEFLPNDEEVCKALLLLVEVFPKCYEIGESRFDLVPIVVGDKGSAIDAYYDGEIDGYALSGWLDDNVWYRYVN